jgi:GH43 family beta-xylosidase
MGLLWADANADLLNAASWQKKPEPVFATNAALKRFGPGHNSFVLAEDGKTEVMVYHSRDYRDLQGTPLTDPNRHTRLRLLQWDANGFVLFAPEQAD